MAVTMNSANTTAFYIWLESVAHSDKRVAIHARDAMATGMRLQVMETTQVNLNPAADRIARRRRKQKSVAAAVPGTRR